MAEIPHVCFQNKRRFELVRYASFVFYLSAGLGVRSRIEQEMRDAGVTDSSFTSLADKMAAFLLHSRADATNRKYFNCFKRWESFINSKGFSALPAAPIHVALYITELLDKGCSSGVVSSALYSIKWAHSLNNLIDPTDNGYVKNLLESAKRTAHAPLRKKEPITSEHLRDLCGQYIDDDDILVVRDLCMFVISFSGFLRYDELSSIRCNDIKFHSDYFSIQIRKSKTDMYRLGKEIVINKGTSTACPYNMLKRYLKISGQDTSSEKFLFRAVFRSKQNSGLIQKDRQLSYTRARECMIARLKPVCGNADIGLHSLRAGGATEAANAGVNDRCWKRHGRWKSDSSKDGYVVDSISSRLEVSRKLNL